MKKHYLKELTVSDVVVALINQEKTVDHTASLKQYLYKTVRHNEQKQSIAQELILLPDFAQQEMTEQELFLYHLQRNNWSSDQCMNYESLLQSVNERRKKIIENSSSTFQKSDEIMNQLIQKLKDSYEYLHQNRKPLHKLTQHIQHEYLIILVKIRKVKNMEKALDIMKLWNKSNISKVLRLKPQNMHDYKQIDKVFQSFEEIGVFLHDNKDQLISYTNLVSLLEDRKKAIINQVFNNMIKSIKQFTDETTYGTKFDQYSYILQNTSIPKQMQVNFGSQSLLREENLSSLIERDIHEIYFETLSSKGKSYNLQLLNQDVYINFFAQLMREFNHYFSNWHKVTTFHFHRETPFKEGFIKSRIVVFQMMLDRISQSLKFSAKFTFISLINQLQLFQKIQGFIDCGEQWMGKCKSPISSILLDKYKQQTQTFYKVNNGELKSSLFQEFSINVNEQTKQDDMHFKENDKLKVKLRLNDEMLVQVRQFSKLKLDYAKIQRLLYEKPSNKSQICPQNATLTQQALQSQMKIYYQQLNTKLGLRIFKNIVQYQLRQSYLPAQTQLNLIYQHLQFIIFIIYKVCITNSMKRQLQKEIFNDLERDQRLSALKVALTKNSIEESTFATINELRHIFLERNAFGDLHEFIFKIGNKYQGTSIATYINVTLYFTDYQKFQGEIKNLHEKFLTVMNELYLLTQYLEKCIQLGRFFKASQQIKGNIIRLKEVIPAIVLVYFTVYYQSSSQKYYNYVLPMFMSIRFDIKKLAADTLIPFRDYRAKIQEIYRQNSIVKFIQPTCFYQMLYNKQHQYFFKFLIDLFSRIEKINDNGRQILKSQILQFSRFIGIQRSLNNGQNWLSYFESYIQASKERNQSLVLEKVGKFVLQFPIQWWKSNINWIYYDSSSKQKKEYLYKIVSAYYNRILSLPRI